MVECIYSIIGKFINSLIDNNLLCGKMDDEISKTVLKIINKSKEPLETKEVEERVKAVIKDVTRTYVFSSSNFGTRSRIRSDEL